MRLTTEADIVKNVEITYLGHSSFRIRGKVVVVTDPYDEMAGKFPREVSADIVTISHDHGDHNATDRVQGAGEASASRAIFKVQGPGEYEVKGVSIIGVHSFHDDKNGAERGTNTIYVIEVDGLRVVHLGDLGHKLSQEQLDDIGPIDVVMVPVGGKYTIDAKTAVEVVKQLDPWVVIPMHYQQEGLDQKAFGELKDVGEFLKEMGKPDIQPVPKFVISADRMPTEMQVVVLERK